jgi:branched-chain amino acid transport system substrate-binding protein
MDFPGIGSVMEKYEARAQIEGVDSLGHFNAPFAYAQLDILGHTVRATNSLDDDKPADSVRATSLKTVVGEVRFGSQGE